MIEILNTNIKKFEKIIHVADCHIRLTKRHQEYREIFNRLFESIKSTTENTAVFCLGDIINSKLDLSPECVQITKEFLCGSANLRPTILIAGNHDCNLSNKNRLDSLSPIVEAINHPNLFYLKKSGLYGLGNVCINNYSIFDSPDDYIKGNDIPQIYRNQYEHFVCLFHGQVDGSITDLGFKLVNPTIPISLFDHHEIVCLGDIHLQQTLQEYDYQNNKPIVRYPGSLISQNHSEIGPRGYTWWDLKSKTYKQIDVFNDYGFYTISLKNGVVDSDLTDLPKKARIRFQLTNTTPTEIKAALIKVRQITEVIESSYQKIDSGDSGDSLARISTSNGNVVLGNINEQSYQESLIREYLKTRLNIVDPAFVDGVLKINKEINDSVKKDDFARNIRWIPIKLEFSDMFGYGKNNVINFTKIKNLVGLFSKNASGKSSIFSILTFCLFDKTERENNSVNIMNTQKTTFDCKFEFEIDGKRYFIKRNANKDKRGKVKVDVRFWKLENDQEIDLNGEQRRNTNEIIREYLGSYDDFVLTSLSVQNGKNNTSIIDIGDADRKDLFAQFMGLTLFDRLHEVANEKLKERIILLRTYKNDDYTQKLLDWSNLLSQAESLYREEIANLDVITDRKEVIQKKILEETQKLINIDYDIPPWPQIEKQKNKLEHEISETKKGLTQQEAKVLEIQETIKWVANEIRILEVKEIVEIYKKYQELILKKTSVQWKLDNLKILFESELKIINKSKKHEYDPECKFCVANAGKIVEDAEEAKKKIETYKGQYILLKEELNKIDVLLKDSEWVVDSNEEYQKLLGKRNSLKDELQLVNSKCVSYKEGLKENEYDLKETEKDVIEYNKNKNSIDINGKINLQIEAFKQELSNAEQGYKTKNRTVMDMNSKISVCKSKITEINQRVDQIKEVEKEYKLYEVYCQSVSRDGIPFDVITATVPEIQTEVNSILGQMCEFTALFETDGKNIVPYIVYDDKKWLMSLSSGFERFALSLAIRVALINVSNLPHSNFLILDEGMSVMDGENLSKLPALFSYLKSQFDFIIIISHLDVIRDYVDSNMEITKDKEGFFHIDYI